MGKPTGFLEYNRHDRSYVNPEERVQHFREFVVPLEADELKKRHDITAEDLNFIK